MAIGPALDIYKLQHSVWAPQNPTIISHYTGLFFPTLPSPELHRHGCRRRDSAAFDEKRHHFFLAMMLDALPAEYQGQEINTLTLAYFALSSLQLLGRLDQADRDQVVDWVLSFQCHPGDAPDLGSGEFYGFCGSKSSQFCGEDGQDRVPNIGNIASTYSALAILRIVGYDLLNLDAELFWSP